MVTDIFYYILIGFLSQNLALSLGIGSGNLLKLSKNEFNGRRRYFFLIMLTVTFLAVVVTYFLDTGILINIINDGNHLLTVLRPVIYLAVVAVLEIAAEYLLSIFTPVLREKIGDMLPNACFNSCVLAILLLNRQNEMDFLGSVIFALTATIALVASIMLMQALRERVELVRCPAYMKGAPLTLLAAGLLSLAFMGLKDISFRF